VQVWIPLFCLNLLNSYNSGFTFWTDNADYLRLNSLHSVVFNKKYRETLAKDSASHYIFEGSSLKSMQHYISHWHGKEYKRTSDALGVVKSDTLALAFRQGPPWYWLVAHAMIVRYPLVCCDAPFFSASQTICIQVLYALALPWALSASTLATMTFFQHAMYTLCGSIENMRRNADPATLTDTLHEARRFYEMLSLGVKCGQGPVEYPNFLSSPKGMKLSFR
jgi:hypothetical protein